MKPAIIVENLAKQYPIGAALNQSYRTLRETIMQVVTAPWQRLRQLGQPSVQPGSNAAPDTLWALKGVSFAIQPGEVVGIIGRNGAGKSTLLKLLSRITEPTRGRIELCGRLSSLLEVGTGFHSELTGRENIFLSGVILGMTRREVTRKLDEIVAFADVGPFLDIPVKRYSTGMQVRLAFAVAAHLEPEILVVDEVLAVGDAGFQKKCLNKMEVVGKQGRTVIFVSHHMQAVTRLCPRTILLNKGSVLSDGPSHQVVSDYLRSDKGSAAYREWSEDEKAPGNNIVRLKSVRVRSQEDETMDALDIRRPVGIEMEYEVLKEGHVLVPNFHFHNDEGTCVFILHEHDPAWRRRPRPSGHYVSRVWIPGNMLAEGMLVVGAAISTHDPLIVHLWEREAVAFQVIDSLDGDSARGDYAGRMPGAVRPMFPWETEFTPGRGDAPCGRSSTNGRHSANTGS
jgi:lipopolysaccharide transport system ATP-binding protein